MSSVKLLFGFEFWDFLEKSISTATKHVFIFSAYAKQQDLQHLVSKIAIGVPYLVIVRDDIDRINENNLIYINKDKFHAKLYIVDDIIIIGSQNIYKVVKIPLKDKTGELSVAFRSPDSVNVIYQTLMLVLREEYETYYQNKVHEYQKQYEYCEEEIDIESVWVHFFREYRLESFLNIRSGYCPSCGNLLDIKENEFCKIYCQPYNETISADECGNGNGCKYCFDDRKVIEPNILYSCTICDFKLGYITQELGKAPYWSWEVLSSLGNTVELEQFLKLYFYLIEKVGEVNTNSLLISLKIIGNLSRLDIEKRYYEIGDLFL
jgi:hypothetical protein